MIPSQTEKQPRIAIVHDWLNTKVGGGEKVLLELAAMYPEAPIYTLLYNRANYEGLLDHGRVRTSRLQRFPAFLRNHQRYLLPFVSRAIEAWKFDNFDIVISSSSAFAKGIKPGPNTVHICYCHSPMRFVWDYWPRYASEQHVGKLTRAAIHVMTSRLRVWDYYSSKRVAHWIANSQTTKKRIAKYYRQDAAVIYPPVETEQFAPIAPDDKENYYVIVASLTPYKKIDLAIQAFNASGRNLLIIGDGADRRRLQAMAKGNIKFTGRLAEDLKPMALAKAKAMIFANEEDFGIAPVEAMASGTPVIAYGYGGLTETVVDGTTGLFFYDQTPEALNAAIDRFETLEFDQAALVARAAEFDAAKFRASITKIVAEATHV